MHEKQQLWFNMALATGVAAFLFPTAIVLVLLGVGMNMWAWRLAYSTKTGTGKTLAGTALTAVALAGFFRDTTFV